jgi:hypothetical protein
VRVLRRERAIAHSRAVAKDAVHGGGGNLDISILSIDVHQLDPTTQDERFTCGQKGTPIRDNKRAEEEEEGSVREQRRLQCRETHKAVISLPLHNTTGPIRARPDNGAIWERQAQPG